MKGKSRKKDKMEEKGTLQVNNQRGAMMEVLRQGSELTKQLQNQLQHSPKRSQDTKAYLIEKILACYEQAMSMALSSRSINGISGYISQTATSAAGFSSWSEISDQDRNHHQYITAHHVSTNRKTLPRWSKTVKVACGSASRLEGPLDDGYNWRKYGQKDIHGAKFPRAYYRCTYSNSRGCSATKHVQKTDEDPTIFHVKYRGHHTCSSIKQLPILHNPQSQILSSPPPNPEPSSVLIPPETDLRPQQKLPAEQSLEIKTENLTDHYHHQVAVADDHHQRIFRNFSFPTSGALLDNETIEDYTFPDPFSYGFGESNYYGEGFNGHIYESNSFDPQAAGGYDFGLVLDGLDNDPHFTIDGLFP